MKDAATKSYGRKGEKVVAMNHAAIDARCCRLWHQVEVPAAWKHDCRGRHRLPRLPLATVTELVDFVNNIQTPVNASAAATSCPVSTFLKDADGTFPQGSAAYEKRGIAVDVPTLELRQLYPV